MHIIGIWAASIVLAIALAAESQAQQRTEEGNPGAEAQADEAETQVPDGPVTPDKATVTENYVPQVTAANDSPFFEATGTALITGDISEDQAIRIARQDARRRVLQAAIGAQTACTNIVEDFRLANSFCQESAKGLTENEEWVIERQLLNSGQPGAERKTFSVTAKLRAQVRALSKEKAPQVDVTISADRVSTDEPFTITVSAASEAFIAIYNRFGGEFSDGDRIVRLYPFDGDTAVNLGAGENVTIPPEGKVFVSEPRASRKRDVEQIVIVASSRPFQSRWFAEGLSQAKYRDANEQTISYQQFLRALNSRDLAYFDIQYRPIVVTRSGS